MVIHKKRAMFCNCNNCEKRLDGELINIIELRLIRPITLCNECTNGLYMLLGAGLSDGKPHTYVAETRQLF